jgi:hypothetical protein
MEVRPKPSGPISGFQKGFCARLSVFIITLYSNIGLRRNWCCWKAKKKILQLKCLEDIRTAHCPDRKGVASGRPPDMHCF